MHRMHDLLERNRVWAERVEAEDPGFFTRLSRIQKPKYLWIGCSDSRVPANQIIDMAPGEVFVHRNVANVVVHTDLNCLSVIQYAIDVLEVEHILVVGHYGCAGVGAALDGQRVGLADNWIRHVKDVKHKHRAIIEDLDDHAIRHDRLCELNALEQMINVAESTVVREAWARGQKLALHAWVYSLRNGRVHDLGLSIDSPTALPEQYDPAVERIRDDREDR
ncbi:carbonate dehydratase [Luteimonas sp. MC1828]|uniref:carbonate dehydratase n=1 Tax=Luteimonas sp. MC1828 TaxID=2799787 RepID=UPI0018F1E489|nr:carbonate dehydratase [Luteimonas sp. MC1828]MBJ7574078.1 carbonate dehydratase [Luteimonas sp. MC1828]